MIIHIIQTVHFREDYYYIIIVLPKMVNQLIEKMKFNELKDIWRLRGLRVSGKKSELVARVFVAKKHQTTEGGSRFSPVI